MTETFKKGNARPVEGGGWGDAIIKTQQTVRKSEKEQNLEVTFGKE